MGMEDKKRNSTYETALCLARLWGIRETLERVDNISQEEVCGIVTEWAEEFASSGQRDLAEFFATKAQTVQTAQGKETEGGEASGDRLLGRLYDKVVYWEDDAKRLDTEYEKIVDELLDPLRETMEEATVKRISETVFKAAYQARKNGFMVGARFTAKLLLELSAYT